MPRFNFGEEAKKAETGSYFKAKEGDNKVRLVSEFILHASSYQGRPTKKFVGYVIDRTDGAIKPAFLAKTIIDIIADLQLSGDEYGFEEVPMPYDINIKATGAGTKEVQYSVIPARSNPELTEDQKKAIAELDIREFVLALQKTENETAVPQPQQPVSSIRPMQSGETFEEVFGKEEVTEADIPM